MSDEQKQIKSEQMDLHDELMWDFKHLFDTDAIDLLVNFSISKMGIALHIAQLRKKILHDTWYKSKVQVMRKLSNTAGGRDIFRPLSAEDCDNYGINSSSCHASCES